MVYCTGLENRQTATSQRFESFSLRKLALSHNGSAADSRSASGGSIPSRGNISKELWQTWCMCGTENPENVVRLHEAPLKNRECSNGNEGGLEFLELAKKSAV